MPNGSGEKADFIGFAVFHYDHHLVFLTRLYFIILKPQCLTNLGIMDAVVSEKKSFNGFNLLGLTLNCAPCLRRSDISKLAVAKS